MYDRLQKEIEYAKTSLSARDLLLQTYGKILLAFELEHITDTEYFELSHLCVCEGINNPKYF